MEAIVKSLIKDSLLISKLIVGLNNIGVDASPYHLNISNTILTIMGIKMNDDEFDVYDKLFDESCNIDIEDSKALNQLTNKIYRYLIKLKG
jgi:hypothetical protein